MDGGGGRGGEREREKELINIYIYIYIFVSIPSLFDGFDGTKKKQGLLFLFFSLTSSPSYAFIKQS